MIKIMFKNDNDNYHVMLNEENKIILKYSRTLSAWPSAPIRLFFFF